MRQRCSREATQLLFAAREGILRSKIIVFSLALEQCMLWDDHERRCIGELAFRSEVRSGFVLSATGTRPRERKTFRARNRPQLLVQHCASLGA